MIELVLGQSKLRTDHDRTATGQISAKETEEVEVRSTVGSGPRSRPISQTPLDETYLRNCGRIEVQPLRSCRRVRYSSKVDTVVGSVFMVAIRL